MDTQNVTVLTLKFKHLGTTADICRKKMQTEFENNRLCYEFNFNLSLIVRKPVLGVPTRSDTNQAVKPQKMARGLKFWIEVVEGLHYPYSENKGADQLRKKPVYSQRG